MRHYQDEALYYTPCFLPLPGRLILRALSFIVIFCFPFISNEPDARFAVFR